MKRLIVMGLLIGSACLSDRAHSFDWPVAHPQQAPEGLDYLGRQPAQLIPLILGERSNGDWRDTSITACVWFMWKTRHGDVGQRWRTKLRDLIFTKLKHSRNKHDLALLAEFLGPLGARAQIRVLLEQINGLDCCYGPALVRGLGECGTREDIPFLLTTLDKRESEVSGGITHESLVKLARFNPLPNDTWPYDRMKLMRVWREWWTTQRH